MNVRNMLRKAYGLLYVNTMCYSVLSILMIPSILLFTTTQAYRLEPLVNERYTSIKPVKVDSAGSKPSKDMVDLASGPRTQEQLQPQTKGWFDTLSQWFPSKKPSQANSTDGGKPKPDKVTFCFDDPYHTHTYVMLGVLPNHH